MQAHGLICLIDYLVIPSLGKVWEQHGMQEWVHFKACVGFLKK